MKQGLVGVTSEDGAEALSREGNYDAARSPGEAGPDLPEHHEQREWQPLLAFAWYQQAADHVFATARCPGTVPVRHCVEAIRA